MPAKLKIRKGDKVVVIAGKDKGKSGEVLKIQPKSMRAIVQGVNLVRRHQKQTAGQEGGIISKEMPFICRTWRMRDPKDGKPTRIGYKTLKPTASGYASPSVPRRRSMAESYVPRLRKHYEEVVRPKLSEQFGYKNLMEVPQP